MATYACTHLLGDLVVQRGLQGEGGPGAEGGEVAEEMATEQQCPHRVGGTQVVGLVRGRDRRG